MSNLLSSDYVGELRCAEDVINIQQRLVMEGVVGVKATGMGDLLVLLVKSEVGDVERAKAHQLWWRTVFKSVRKWSPRIVVEKWNI